MDLCPCAVCFYNITIGFIKFFTNLILGTNKELPEISPHLHGLHWTFEDLHCWQAHHKQLAQGSVKVAYAFPSQTHSSRISLNSSISQYSHVGWGYRAKWHSRGDLFNPCSLNCITIINNHLAEWKMDFSRSATVQPPHSVIENITQLTYPHSHSQTLFVSLFFFFSRQL